MDPGPSRVSDGERERGEREGLCYPARVSGVGALRSYYVLSSVNRSDACDAI